MSLIKTKLFTTKETVLIGIFTALMVIMAQVTIPLGISPVPITMQVFALCFAASVQGAKCAVTSQLIYIMLGIAGVPVFSGFGSGLSAVAGPKGGYIVSFPLAALVIGLLTQRKEKLSFVRILVSMAAGLVIVYAIGTAWLGFSLGLSFEKAVLLGAGWYLPLDAIKIFAAAYLSLQIRKRVNI